MKRILLVTDAWAPQVNGVVRTLETIIKKLEEKGLEIKVISPDMFRTLPLPIYPEIRLSLFPYRKLVKEIESFKPDAIHISTEGPLGWSARKVCLKKGLRFTTSYHTKFPEYVNALTKLPLSWGYKIIKKFHSPSNAVMVATKTLQQDLEKHGFENIVEWTRGVDMQLFNTRQKPALSLPKPVAVYVGRISLEKNLEAFLELELPGTKLLVGDGPQLDYLKSKYPNAIFTGAKFGHDLAAHYRSGDIFVFPSRTDTFGLVMLEAMACGLPVAAYPVTGPLDVIRESPAGCLDENLEKAIEKALKAKKKDAVAHAKKYSWEACAERFYENLMSCKN
ncbi:MAG: glycosyltransferase family 4 protein [Parvibaculales bacterium]